MGCAEHSAVGWAPAPSGRREGGFSSAFAGQRPHAFLTQKFAQTAEDLQRHTMKFEEIEDDTDTDRVTLGRIV